MDINIIWMICDWIIFGFEMFGLILIAVTLLIAIYNPGAVGWIDKIRNYMLMLDEEDLE